MSDLTYVPAEAPARPFKVGDLVDVIDREGKVMSTREVTKKEDSDVLTDCGRWWTRSGWWIGDCRAWPFPTIRHSQSPQDTKHD